MSLQPHTERTIDFFPYTADVVNVILRLEQLCY